MTAFTANFTSKFPSSVPEFLCSFTTVYVHVSPVLYGEIHFTSLIEGRRRLPNTMWALSHTISSRAQAASAFPFQTSLSLKLHCLEDALCFFGVSLYFPHSAVFFFPAFLRAANSNFLFSLLPLPSPYYLDAFYIKISATVPGRLLTLASNSPYRDHNLGEGINTLTAYTCTSHPLLSHFHIIITDLCVSLACEHLTKHTQQLNRYLCTLG